jgi:hypothetical protein
MAEGHRAAPQAAASWIAEGGLGVHLRGSRLQSGPNPKSSKATSTDRLKRVQEFRQPQTTALRPRIQATQSTHNTRTRIEDETVTRKVFFSSLVGERREAASVQPGLDVAVPDALR